MKDDLQWKTNLDGGRPWMENDLRWKTSLDGRWPSMKDNLQSKTTFHGRWPFMEDNRWWKTTFNERQPSMKHNPQWNTTFNGTQLLLELPVCHILPSLFKKDLTWHYIKNFLKNVVSEIIQGWQMLGDTCQVIDGWVTDIGERYLGDIYPGDIFPVHICLSDRYSITMLCLAPWYLFFTAPHTGLQYSTGWWCTA